MFKPVLQVCQLQTTKMEPYRFLFCLDLSMSRSVDHQGLLIIICIQDFFKIQDFQDFFSLDLKITKY